MVVRDPQGSELYRQPLTGRTVIGRTHDCQIILKSTAISRQHARLELFKNQPVFVDLGSSNGSQLDGKPLSRPSIVDEKSRIEIAGFQISLERAGAAPALIVTAPQLAPPLAPDELPPANVPAADVPDLDLVPMKPARTPGSRSAAAAPGGFNFLDLPTAPSPTESAPRLRASTDSAVDLLDQQLEGIRTYREVTAQSEKAHAAKVDEEWIEVLVAIRQLKAKIEKNPKVQHFTISRDEQEVSVKVEDSSKRGYSYYVLGRRHPTGKYDNLDVVWLCELGGEELTYKTPKEAMADLVRRIAPRLA